MENFVKTKFTTNSNTYKVITILNKVCSRKIMKKSKSDQNQDLTEVYASFRSIWTNLPRDFDLILIRFWSDFDLILIKLGETRGIVWELHMHCLQKIVIPVVKQLQVWKSQFNCIQIGRRITWDLYIYKQMHIITPTKYEKCLKEQSNWHLILYIYHQWTNHIQHWCMSNLEWYLKKCTIPKETKLVLCVDIEYI